MGRSLTGRTKVAGKRDDWDRLVHCNEWRKNLGEVIYILRILGGVWLDAERSRVGNDYGWV